MNDLGFALNYTNLHEIWDGSNWLRVGAGITSITPAGNEKTDQSDYYDGDGLASTLSTGGQLVISISGARLYGDPAQDYVASLMMSYGAARNSRYRWTAPNGDVIEGAITIANIVSGGGDAPSKGTFSFEAHFNGLPQFTAGDADTFPESITASAVNVVVGATAKVAASIAPMTASPALAYAIEDTAIATVASDGVVTGVAAGETRLSIKSMAKPSVVVAVAVTVSAG